MTLEEIRKHRSKGAQCMEFFQELMAKGHFNEAVQCVVDGSARNIAFLERFVRYVADGQPAADGFHGWERDAVNLKVFRDLAREIVKGLDA